MSSKQSTYMFFFPKDKKVEQSLTNRHVCRGKAGAETSHTSEEVFVCNVMSKIVWYLVLFVWVAVIFFSFTLLIWYCSPD